MRCFVLTAWIDLTATPGGEVVSQARCGEAVTVLCAQERGWVEVVAAGERGFCRADALGAWHPEALHASHASQALGATPARRPADPQSLWVVSVEALAYAVPARRAGPPVQRLPLGARLPFRAADRGPEGFVEVLVRGDPGPLPTQAQGVPEAGEAAQTRRQAPGMVRDRWLWVQREDLGLDPPQAVSPAERLTVAEALRGRPYVWGGCTSLGLDCSGLCRLLAALAGVELPHAARRQATMCTERFAVVAGVDAAAPGDFVYLAASGGRADHVVVWAGGHPQDALVLHASAQHGPPCVREEPWNAVQPRGAVVAVRRLIDDMSQDPVRA